MSSIRISFQKASSSRSHNKSVKRSELNSVKLDFVKTKTKPVLDQWFNRLKKNEGQGSTLFARIPRDRAVNYFIVYRMNTYKGNTYRQYAAFRGVSHFYKFFQQNPGVEYHEVILGDRPQKPRFDIDLTYDRLSNHEDILRYGNELVEDVIESATLTLLDFGIELDIENDVVICTSHSDDIDSDEQDENTKFSCHIIFKNLAHSNHLEAKEFFKLCLEQKIGSVFDAAKRGILDAGVYSATCSLRIIHCCKSGQRRKKVVERLNYRGDNIEFRCYQNMSEQSKFQLFRDVSVTNTAECNFIPIKVESPEKVNPDINLPEGAEEYIMEHLRKYVLQDDDGELPFKLTEVDGGLITLTRLRTSVCGMCRRPHDSTHPYMIVTESGDVYFYCRRAQDEYIFTKRQYRKKICQLPKKLQPIVNDKKGKSKRIDGLIVDNESESESESESEDDNEKESESESDNEKESESESESEKDNQKESESDSESDDGCDYSQLCNLRNKIFFGGEMFSDSDDD